MPEIDDRALISVTAPVSVPEAGVIDAHNHAWIDPVPGGASDAPVLNDPRIADELSDFHRLGGGVLVDCQPGGCGRNGEKLRWLSTHSGVKIIACTGFHLQKYYPQDHWLFQAAHEQARRWFSGELTLGLEECSDLPQPPRAGLVKVACEASLEQSPQSLMEAAVAAAVEVDVALAVHTEKGSQAERIARRLVDWGLPAERLILFHVDKRPDYALHRDLAQQGVLLEYDTFYRQKYDPQRNLWPLLEKMVAEGYDAQVAIGTDMAEPGLWARLGGSPGLTGLFTEIIPHMRALGFHISTIQRLAGGNMASRLARRNTI